MDKRLEQFSLMGQNGHWSKVLNIRWILSLKNRSNQPNFPYIRKNTIAKRVSKKKKIGTNDRMMTTVKTTSDMDHLNMKFLDRLAHLRYY